MQHAPPAAASELRVGAFVVANRQRKRKNGWRVISFRRTNTAAAKKKIGLDDQCVDSKMFTVWTLLSSSIELLSFDVAQASREASSVELLVVGQAKNKASAVQFFEPCWVQGFCVILDSH